MKTRQNIRKRIAAARRALQITKEAERKAEIASNVERLLERERRVSLDMTRGGAR